MTFGLLLLITLQPCQAQEESHAIENIDSSSDNQDQQVIALPKIRVHATIKESTFSPSGDAGKWHLSRDAIENHGKSDGHVTSALEAFPNIHFDNERRNISSLTNLAPPSVSISGGRSYENNFTLDGLSINSRFDPGHNGKVPGDLPGHDQALFIDLNLVESVDVWQSNVPSRHGRFLGGAVDIKTRNPSYKPQTEVSWSGTDSDMVKTRIFSLENPTNPIYVPPEKPEFSRNRASMLHSRPLTGSTGLVTSLTRSYSNTPTIVVGETQQKTQESQSLFVKFQHEADSGANMEASTIYAPYKIHEYLDGFRNSGFTIKGGGIALSGKTEWLSRNDHKMQISAGYSRKESSRDAPTNSYSWVITSSKPWGAAGPNGLSSEGGVGDLDKEDHSAFVKIIGESTELFTGERAFTLEYGSEIITSSIGFDRPVDSIVYRDALLNPNVNCRGSIEDCVDNEQYFSKRNIYAQENVKVSLLEAAAFIEASSRVKRFNLTAGLRTDYNDYTRKIDIAPRFRSSFDIFDNGNSTLVFGANRYYGAALLTYKLREARKPYYQEYRSIYQNIVNDWQRNATQDSRLFRSYGLDTPYSDELSLALRQRIWGGHANIELLQRKNRDQLSMEATDIQQDVLCIQRLNNKGFSTYQSISLGWERHWKGDVHSGLSVTWAKAESTNEVYDNVIDGSASDPYVWYNDTRYARAQLDILRRNFYRPIVATFRISKRFERFLRTGISVRYESSFDNIIYSGSRVIMPGPDGLPENLPVMIDSYRPRVITADASMDLTPWPKHDFSITLNIENIAHAENYTVPRMGIAEGVEVGRTYSLGLKYRF